MSDRPTDWSSVDRDCDPTPGDPVVVRDGGQKYQAIAGALARAAATLRRLNGGASSGSDSVVALLEDCDDIAENLSTAQNRYQAAGDALVTYAYALDQIQATTLQALTAANTARDSMVENTRLADQYARWASYATAPERGEERSYYLRMEVTYRTAAAGDQSTIDLQKQIIDQAVADRDRAANTAVSQIEDVTSTDGLNDSWWDDWGAKIVTWIADIAEAIASIAGILALVVCWIPIIGQALAGVLMVIAAVTSIIAALGNIALAATGERTWTQAVISIVGAALACVGLGAFKGAFTGLKAGMGAWKAAGGLAGQGGLKAVGLASVKNLTTTIKSGVQVIRALKSDLINLSKRILPGSSDWAKLSGILRDATQGKGNFGLGIVTSNEATILGHAWVGDGARLSAGGKAWVSLDGLRQWRPPSFKPHLGKWQSNLEQRWEPSGQWQCNGHLDIE